MATTPDLPEPQIAAARAQAWHQTGEALLTLEAARAWLQDFGIVAFAPRSASLGAPGPSLVEATLGTSNYAATLADFDVARTLTARLVGEGAALPLNLLGGPGDLPDFLVSAQAFPFVFTLRGDKGWKRPPETSGAVKVTPLGLAVYELLAEKGSLTVAEIVSEVGREVTESAVTRALSELWQILRVIPVLQQGQGETRWELITARFLKAVKAGANAGQPTALSALVSLYLAQVYVASEEEVAGFLSPLTGRARVRDVLHGLTAGRQLAEAVISGKTVVYVPDALPDFAAFAEPEAESDAVTEGEAVEALPRERIQRFDGGTERGKDRNLRGKPVRREDSARPARDNRGGAGRGEGGGFAPRTSRPAVGGFTRKPREDRGGETGERRPYTPRTDRSARPAREGGERSTLDRRPKRAEGEGFARRPAAGRSEFARPWDEERAARPPRSRGGEGATFSDDRGARPPRPRRDDGGDRPARPFRGGADSRPPRRDAGDRPPFRRRDEGSSGGGERRLFAGGDRSARPFRPRAEGEGRPFRPKAEGSERPARPRTEGGDRPYRPRAEGGDRPYRSRAAEGGDRPYRPRVESGDRPYRPRAAEGGDRPYRPRPDRGTEGGAPRERRGPGGPPSRFGAGDRPARPRREDGGGEPRGERPAGRGRPSFGGGGSSEGRAPRGDRPQGRFGDRPSFRPGPRSGGGAGAGFRSGPKKGPGTKSTGRPSGPARGPRPPRREDEA